MKRRWPWLLLAVLLVAGAAVPALARPVPTGVAGPEAEAAADRMLAAVDAEAWARTGAIRWSMTGRHHTWDKANGKARVRWGDNDVTVDTNAPAADELSQRAYAWWANDSFWLNPVVKVRDPGTERFLTDRGLLVRYTSGGVTPGDAYLWEIGDEGLPTQWRMWVQVLPVKGLRVTWEDWVTLATGARVATTHRFAGTLAMRVEGLVGAETLGALGE
jgi:hypothetical protein